MYVCLHVRMYVCVHVCVRVSVCLFVWQLDYLHFIVANGVCLQQLLQ